MKQFSVLSLGGVAIALWLVVGCSGKGDNPDVPDDPTAGECAIDDSSMPDNGLLDPDWELKDNTNSSQNYICPANTDVDYFWFTTATDGVILSVHLWNNALSSPINLCYSIIPAIDHNQTLGSKKCRGTLLGQIDIQATHYIAESGTYFIKVWADNGKEDRLHPYLVKINQVLDPDAYEQNNTKDQAKTVVTDQKGYLSYLGDQDWFRIDGATPDQMLSIALATDGRSELNLHYDVYLPDGITVLSSGDKYNAIAALSINDMLALPQAGTYYVVITDKEGDTSSATVGYTLTLSLSQNPDIRDQSAAGNNLPANATPLTSGVSIGNAYVASRGDQDWYRISSSGVTLNTPKLLYIDVTFNSSSPVYPAVDLLVGDPNSSCSQDSTCGLLSIVCLTNNACFTGECATNGYCVGAGVCLPSSTCAIRELVMRYSDNWRENYSVSGNPHHLQTVAPLYGNDYYIVVRDFNGQYFDSTYSYTITAAVINEPDSANEINSLYLPYTDQNQDEDLRGLNLKYATPLTCNASGSDYDCGNVTGYLSFRGDQDWYRLDGIPDLAETTTAGLSTKVDWGFQIDWSNTSTVTDLNLELFMNGSLQDTDKLLSWHHQGTGSGTIGTSDCAYVCGEYQTNRPIYLRVQHSDRTLYDYSNSYTLAIRAIRGCPSICGTCRDECNCYACPTPTHTTPDPGSCNEALCD